MEFFEELALETALTRPRLWKRYVDDTFCILRKGLTEELLHHLNWVRPTIKFTVEQEEDGTLLSLTCYSGEEEMAAWMSLSTGSPCIQTDISTSSPTTRPFLSFFVASRSGRVPLSSGMKLWLDELGSEGLEFCLKVAAENLDFDIINPVNSQHYTGETIWLTCGVRQVHITRLQGGVAKQFSTLRQAQGQGGGGGVRGGSLEPPLWLPKDLYTPLNCTF